MSKSGFSLVLVLVFFSLSLSGCYYFSAKKEMGNAQTLLDQLKNAGGPIKAPYEYLQRREVFGDFQDGVC